MVDILRRVKLLILKARVFAKAGVPVKGFSMVLRAASSAHRASLLPLMWEAVGALCNILLDLDEFGAVKRLVEAIMPLVSAKRRKLVCRPMVRNHMVCDVVADQLCVTEQVLEGGNEYLTAQLYCNLTDACVGLAGHAFEEASKERESHINAAALYVERAKDGR